LGYDKGGELRLNTSHSQFQKRRFFQSAPYDFALNSIASMPMIKTHVENRNWEEEKKVEEKKLTSNMGKKAPSCSHGVVCIIWVQCNQFIFSLCCVKVKKNR